MTPVSAAMARQTSALQGPGSVRKLSPEILKRVAMATPVSAATRAASSSIQAERLAPEWASLKRMLRAARASAGITLVAGLPVSMVVSASVEGLKCAVPVSSSRLARRSRSRTSAGERVQRAVGIGGVALGAAGGHPGAERAAAADLDHLAHPGRAGGLADQAVVHALAVRRHPVEDGERAVDAGGFLVAGDGEDDAALRRGGGGEVDGGGDEGGDAGLHVGGAAAVELAVLDGGGEGRVSPGRGVAGRHDVGVAVEAEDRAGVAPAGEEVGDAVAVGADGAEARPGQHPGEEVEGAALLGGDRGAADQRCRQVDGVGHFVPKSRSPASPRPGTM